MIDIRQLTLTLVFALALLCSGCAGSSEQAPSSPVSGDVPSATVSPSAEPGATTTELELTMSGIESLRLGEPASASDLVEYNPSHCDAGGDGQPVGGWEWKEQSAAGYPIVGLFAPDDVVRAIEVRQKLIPTDRDVRVGDSYNRLRAFYPDMELSERGGFSSTWLLREEDRVMVFEVTHDDYDLARPQENNRILSILVAIDPDETYFSPRANSDYVIGGCI